MSKLLISIILVILLFTSEKAFSQYYLGVGPVFKNPVGTFSEVNKPNFGVNFQFESRQWCLLWYGLRVDYHSLQKKDLSSTEISDKLSYETLFTISPGIRYNFLGSDCYKYDIVPYAQAMLMISSLTSEDDLDPIGMGAAAGIGVAFSFSFMNVCSMVDLNALYTSPNLIFLSEKREVIQSIDITLTLSIRL